MAFAMRGDRRDNGVAALTPGVLGGCGTIREAKGASTTVVSERDGKIASALGCGGRVNWRIRIRSARGEKNRRAWGSPHCPRGRSGLPSVRTAPVRVSRQQRASVSFDYARPRSAGKLYTTGASDIK